MKKLFVTGFFARAMVAAFNLVTLLICSRLLGSSVLGEVVKVVLNVAIIQAITEIFTGPSLVYFIPRSNLSRLYRQGIVWTIVCVLPLSLVFYAFGNFAFGEGLREHWLDVLVLSLLACGTGFQNVLLLGKERVRAYYWVQFLQPALLCITLAISVFFAGMRGSDPYLLALYLSWTVSFCVSLLFLVREFGGSHPVLDASMPGDVIRKGFVNQLGNLAHILSNRFNYYVLAAATAVGVYSSATSLIESVWMVSAAVSPVLLSHVANRKDEPMQRILTLRIARACFVISILFALVLLFIPAGFFTWLLGKDFSGVKEIMLLLAPGVAAVSYSSVISHYYSGKGQQHVLLAANTCGLVITLALSYLMVTRLGLWGAAITASLAYGAQAIYLILKFRKEP
jgi:O-antigen/teichoic acid export membrane protein